MHVLQNLTLSIPVRILFTTTIHVKIVRTSEQVNMTLIGHFTVRPALLCKSSCSYANYYFWRTIFMAKKEVQNKVTSTLASIHNCIHCKMSAYYKQAICLLTWHYYLVFHHCRFSVNVRFFCCINRINSSWIKIGEVHVNVLLYYYLLPLLKGHLYFWKGKTGV